MPDVETVSVYLSAAGIVVLGVGIYGIAGVLAYESVQTGSPIRIFESIGVIGLLLFATGVAIYNLMGDTDA